MGCSVELSCTGNSIPLANGNRVFTGVNPYHIFAVLQSWSTVDVTISNVGSTSVKLWNGTQLACSGSAWHDSVFTFLGWLSSASTSSECRFQFPAIGTTDLLFENVPPAATIKAVICMFVDN